MKVAIYARVSDDKLKEDGERRQDITRQTSKLRAWAVAMGWQVDDADIFCDDGKSAFKEDYQSRPAFVKLLREIRGHHYQRVLVEDLTRWSRRLEDGLRTLKEASDAGCTVSSMHEGEQDLTVANGWFRSAISFLMAEWSSRSMSEKIRSGMRRRTTKCDSCGVIHLGRHPDDCGCKGCRKKRVGKTARGENPQISGATEG